jgi:hypothetical protein
MYIQILLLLLFIIKSKNSQDDLQYSKHKCNANMSVNQYACHSYSTLKPYHYSL